MSEKRTLNPEQEIAANAREGFFCVHAGPGSGKSRCVVERYLRLVESGVDRSEILGLAFTVEAAKNLRARVGDTGKTKRPSGFLTMHSLALSFATEEHANFPFPLAHFPLATGGQANRILAGCLRGVPGVNFRSLAAYISGQKRHGVKPSDALSAATEPTSYALAKAYGQYETGMKLQGLLDFDSMIFEMAALLESNSDVRARWNFQFILTDESQDLDATQWKIIKLLSSQHGNVWAVGDFVQSLYSWRGASPELFTNFDQMFPGAKTLYLGQNYRSTPEIVNFCKAIAPTGSADHMSTENEHGPEPVLTEYASNYAEAEAIVGMVGQHTQHDGDAVAILSRTNRGLRLFEEMLGAKGIKYKLLGKSGYWAQPEIRTVLAFLQIANFPTNQSVLTAIRSPFECCKYIRKKELCDELKQPTLADESIWAKLNAYETTNGQQASAIAGLVRFLHGIRQYGKLPAKDAVEAVLRATKAVDHYDEMEMEIDNSPADNVAELVNIAARFSTLAEFLEFSRKAQNAGRARKDRVILSTIHSAKGREWETVFVIGVAEGILPHKNSIDLGEEQRILFVGASRAARHLYVSWYGTPSRFLRPVREMEAA